MHESFPVKYGLGHSPREVSLLFSLSLSLSAFAVVVLQHLAVHAVFDGEDLEELLSRDGLAYLLVVDGVEACHFCIEAGDFQEAFFMCLLVALGRNILLEVVDAHVYLALLVLVFIVDGEEGLCLLLCKVGFLGNVVFHALAEFLLVESPDTAG